MLVADDEYYTRARTVDSVRNLLNICKCVTQLISIPIRENFSSHYLNGPLNTRNKIIYIIIIIFVYCTVLYLIVCAFLSNLLRIRF